MTKDIEYLIRDGKTAAKFTVDGHKYQVLVHFAHNRWQYYVKAHNCEAVLNLDEQIFDMYDHDPYKIAKRLDCELSCIYKMISDRSPI